MTSTLVDWLEASLADSSQRVRVFAAGEAIEEVPWSAVYRSALRRSAALQHLGVEPGDRVAVLGSTTLPLVETLLATWLAGATSVVLPLPLRFTSAASFADTTRARVVEAGIGVVYGDPQHHEVIDALPKNVRAEVLMPTPVTSEVVEPVAVDPAATAILQFTSGSTAHPKAVRLSHRAVTANARAMGEAASFGPDDHFVSWLPLYHDMGLIGTLLNPMLAGAGATLLPTSSFMAAPRLWMHAISSARGTVTAAPNFAYALASRVLGRGSELDLSSLRAAFCGAEPIAPATLSDFGASGQRHGLRRGVLLPCYGLAEATLAVSIAPLGRVLWVDAVDRTALLEHGSARPTAAATASGPRTKTVELVSLGLPLRGTAVRVVGGDGYELGEREVGELQVASSSLMDGYLDASEPASVGGWLPTGDVGYLADGEVFVCGRVKDLIIVNGHNVHPHEVEAVAERVPGVRMGGTVAFSVDDSGGHESIVVLCESRAGPGNHGTISAEVRRLVSEAIGVSPSHVGVLRPRQVPKTTSGKRQRQLARERFLAGTFDLGGSTR
jgi:fatty-acyl-CoA synthase